MTNYLFSNVTKFLLQTPDYNDGYFENPEEFRPSRWYDIPNDRETFYAFSVGKCTVLQAIFLLLIYRFL